MEMFNLKGKTGVVTGANRGLGESIARALAQAGCDIILAVRSEDKGKPLAKELAEKYGVDSLVLTWDALNLDSIKKLAKDSQDWKGHVDILVNNAGGNRTTSSPNFIERSDEDIRNTIELNLLSPLYCCHEFGRIMLEQGHGKIINIASIHGVIGRDRRLYPGTGINEAQVDYAAAKGGIIAMSRDLAALLGPKGIFVNSISPGGFRHGTSDLFAERYSNLTPLGHQGYTATDLQGAVIFLASSASDYILGHNLVVDGGFTICK
jgi:gluconate 5-dehydrogenase